MFNYSFEMLFFVVNYQFACRNLFSEPPMGELFVKNRGYHRFFSYFSTLKNKACKKNGWLRIKVIVRLLKS